MYFYLFYTVAAMKFNENLQEIWLGNNSLVTEDGQHLGNILRTNHCLKVLDLRDNSLGDAGVKYICAGVSEQAHGLLTLNLRSNSIGPEGFHHVATMLVSVWQYLTSFTSYLLVSLGFFPLPCEYNASTLGL